MLHLEKLRKIERNLCTLKTKLEPENALKNVSLQISKNRIMRVSNLFIVAIL